MIAVDTNLLVYAHRRDSPWHKPAAASLRALAEGSDRWAIPWPCLHEFMAIVTHPRIYKPASTAAEGLRQMESWTEAPTLVLLGESEGYLKVFRSLLERRQVAGPRIHDARIASLCVFHEVKELWTADRDFSAWPEVRARNPLVDN